MAKKSLTEAAKAVLQGTITEGAYPEVSPNKISNPNPVDPSTVNTVNAKTLHPGTKQKDERKAAEGKGAPGPEAFPGAQDLGGATPTSIAAGNLGAAAAGAVGKDTSKSSVPSVPGEPKKTLKKQPQSGASAPVGLPEEMEEEGETIVSEDNANAIAERVAIIKEAAKKAKAAACSMEEDNEEALEEDFELSEELEDFINEGIEAGLSEEEILAAIDENFELEIGRAHV